jgi:hypothetical protein
MEIEGKEKECRQSKSAGIETKVEGREGKIGRRRREKKTRRRYIRGRKRERNKERFQKMYKRRRRVKEGRKGKLSERSEGVREVNGKERREMGDIKIVRETWIEIKKEGGRTETKKKYGRGLFQATAPFSCVIVWDLWFSQS